MGAVHPALAPYVASLTAYDVDLGVPGVHRGLPGTTLTFVLPVGEPLDVGWRGAQATRGRRWSTLSGLHTLPAEIRHAGRQVGVQVALTAAGARGILGMPAAELAGALVEVDEAAPGWRHLPERLHEARAEDRVALVEATLLAGLRTALADDPVRPEVGHALDLLVGGFAVQEVADQVGYSRRHLTTLVRRECGLTPQELRRLGRFERSSALLGRRPLAEVAQRCGYADQAHLTREWAALAGCPPTVWLREEFPFLQDLAPEPEPE